VERRVSGTEDAVRRPSRNFLSAARVGRPPRCLLILSGCFLGAALAILPVLTHAQTQSEIQYTYDAAGRVIGVTRASNKPDLTVSNLSVGTISQVCNGSFTIPVTFKVNNIGTATAVATWYDYGYLSANTTLHNTDQVLGGHTTRSTNLATGTNYTVNTTYTTSTTTTPGNWYLIVKADGGAAASGQYSPTGPNYVDELNEFNNTQVIQITLPGNPKPDFTVSNASIGAIAVSQAGAYSFPVTFTVSNFGATSAQPNWFDLAYLSTNGVLDNNSVNLSGFNVETTPLACGASSRIPRVRERFITT
jgi:YD repeat-containing protein